MVSMVFFRFSAVNGGRPVNMSYISAPSDHQSTAFPCPLRVRISGALKAEMDKSQFRFDKRIAHWFDKRNKQNKILSSHVSLDAHAERWRWVVYAGDSIYARWLNVNRLKWTPGNCPESTRMNRARREGRKCNNCSPIRYSHVLDGAAERVRDDALLDMLLAQPKVRQLDVALRVQQNILRL